MWRIWQLEASLAVLFFILLVPILLAPFLHRIYGRYGRFAGGPAFLAMAAGLYGCALVAFTVLVRRDRRSLSLVIAWTDTVTRRAMEAPPTR